MKNLLLAASVALFHVVFAVKPDVSTVRFGIQKTLIPDLIKTVVILYKPSYNFATIYSSNKSDDLVVKVGEELFQNQNVANESITSESTVILNLPVDQAVDDYVGFKIDAYLSVIGRLVKERESFNKQLAALFQDDQSSSASKCLTQVNHRNVSLRVLELDSFLRSNFEVKESKLSKVQTGMVKQNLKSSIFQDMLISPEKYEAYVYIPENQELEDFIRTSMPKSISDTSKMADVCWCEITRALKLKDDPNTRNIPLKDLLKEISKIHYKKNLSKDKSSNMTDLQDKKIESKDVFIDLPKDLSYNMPLFLCNRIYVDFGSLPIRHESFDDCEIVKDMINTLFEEINSENPLSSLSDLVTKLQSKEMKSNYEKSFTALKSLPIRITIKDLNESIAKKLNSIKFPLLINSSEIIEPPTDSKFEASEYEESNCYIHEEFPNLKYELTSDMSFLLPAYQTAFQYGYFIKEKLNSDQNESVVREEFFKLFWAKKTNVEFFIQLIQLYYLGDEEKSRTAINPESSANFPSNKK